jgi:hypothetical protein
VAVLDPTPEGDVHKTLDANMNVAYIFELKAH